MSKKQPVKSDLELGILARRVTTDAKGNDVVGILVAITCQRCQKPGRAWFELHEPTVGLCASCRKQSDADDVDSFKIEVDKLSESRAISVVAGECEPGKSSGRPRKSVASLGSGENANGVWDNLVRGYEGD
jgi:hypothetical protein